jgi:GTP-binding protein
MFVDHIKIHAKSGDGGSGCVSFRQEKFVPMGGPDGGDGGKGGDIVFEADMNTASLAPLFYQPIIKAKSGENGKGKKKTGRSAKKVMVKVPVGTVIYRMPTSGLADPDVEADWDEKDAKPQRKKRKPIDTSKLEMVADLDEAGAGIVLCAGGWGGKGNVHYKSSRNQTPQQFTEGFPGEEGDFYLELRTIADAGLVGYPNAGKSTLLTKISAATPKVAAYPFTTLHPMVGVVDFPGYERGTVADIPGLIEGAHENVGLGHEFLRHILRCKLLLFVIDMAGTEGREPIDDLATLREELRLYDPLLAKRPWIVVANKMDVPDAAEKLKIFKRRFRKVPVLAISAVGGVGIEELKLKLHEMIREVESEAVEVVE